MRLRMDAGDGWEARDVALVELGRLLREQGYHFITVTPETHRRVNARAGGREARSVRDVFGWSRPFTPDLLPARMVALLDTAGALERREDGRLRSHVRFSSLGPGLYAHSAWPTDDKDAVFFGPDTYRFCDLLGRLPGRFHRAVDLGCGSGAGGLSLDGRVEHLVLADVNPEALRFSRVNAWINGELRAQVMHSNLFRELTGTFDLVMANPPYIADPSGRTYRDGGGAHGEALSLSIVRDALPRLRPGGTLVLYTGAPVVEGEDLLRSALRPLLDAGDLATWDYQELDPDVFGEELEQPGYQDVERIALAALVARRRA